MRFFSFFIYIFGKFTHLYDYKVQYIFFSDNV